MLKCAQLHVPCSKRAQKHLEQNHPLSPQENAAPRKRSSPGANFPEHLPHCPKYAEGSGGDALLHYRPQGIFFPRFSPGEKRASVWELGTVGATKPFDPCWPLVGSRWAIRWATAWIAQFGFSFATGNLPCLVKCQKAPPWNIHRGVQTNRSCTAVQNHDAVAEAGFTADLTFNLPVSTELLCACSCQDRDYAIPVSLLFSWLCVSTLHQSVSHLY